MEGISKTTRFQPVANMDLADILWTWTSSVADMVFLVADIVVADMVCGRYVCHSTSAGFEVLKVVDQGHKCSDEK